jgi:hypothetical protein
MITQWKGFRAMIAPLIEYKPKPTPPKPPGNGSKPNTELESVLSALEQFKLDGKLTEREHQWTVGIATDGF